MKKRIGNIVAMALVAIMLVMSIPTISSPGGTFSDVPSSHWAAENIETMAAGGLIHGYPDGTFRPSGTITLAEMCSLIAYAHGHGGNTEGYWAEGMMEYCMFELNCMPYDVRDDVLMSASVETSYREGGAQLCTREVAVYMIWTGLGINYGKDSRLKAYHNSADNIIDEDEINEECLQCVWNAYIYGLINGYPDGSFRPKDTISRAEIAAILYRAGWLAEGKVVEEGDFYYGGAPITDDWYPYVDTPIKDLDDDVMWKAMGRQFIYELNKYRVEHSGGDLSRIIPWNERLEECALIVLENDINKAETGDGYGFNQLFTVIDYENTVHAIGNKVWDYGQIGMNPKHCEASQEMSPRQLATKMLLYNSSDPISTNLVKTNVVNGIGAWGWLYDQKGNYSFVIFATCKESDEGMCDANLEDLYMFAEMYPGYYPYTEGWSKHQGAA